MITSWDEYFHKVSWGLDKECGFFDNSPFLNMCGFFCCLEFVWGFWPLFGNCLDSLAVVWELFGNVSPCSEIVWNCWPLFGNCLEILALVWKFRSSYFPNPIIFFRNHFFILFCMKFFRVSKIWWFFCCNTFGVGGGVKSDPQPQIVNFIQQWTF